MSERKADARVLPVIVDRWSPRAFDGVAVPAEDLAVIFEAAGLAPSAFNVQPWRFLYAVPGDTNWDAFVDILVPFNQGWAKDAGALVFILSQETSTGPDGKTGPLYSHSFDAGSAWALLAIQATSMGYHTHGMTGIDFDKGTHRAGRSRRVPDRGGDRHRPPDHAGKAPRFPARTRSSERSQARGRIRRCRHLRQPARLTRRAAKVP